MAAEMLAKHDATIREQAAKLESLHQRAVMTETENHRLKSMFTLVSENTNTQREFVTRGVCDTGVHALVDAETRLDVPSAYVKTTHDEQRKNTLESVTESAAQREAQLVVSIQANVHLKNIAAKLAHQLKVERHARNQAENTLRVAEAAAAVARAESEKACSDVKQKSSELKIVAAERDDARFDLQTVTEMLRMERETLRAEMETVLGVNQDTEIFRLEIAKLKTLVQGLVATREELILELRKAKTEKLDAVKCSTPQYAERAKVKEANSEIARAKYTIMTLDAEQDFLETLLDTRAEELAAANIRARQQSQATEEALHALAAADARSLAATEVGSDMACRLNIVNDQSHEMSLTEFNLCMEVGALRRELQAVGEDLAAMTREQQMVNNELVDCTSERDQLALELNQANVANTKLDAIIEATKGEAEDVFAAYQELGSENQRLCTAASALERDNQRAALARDASNSAFEKIHARVRVLEQENRQFVIDIQAFEQQVESLSRKLADTERASAGADQETSQSYTQVAATNTIATHLGHAHQQLQRELAAADSHIHVMRAKLVDSQSECETARQRWRIETNRVRRLETLLAGTRVREYSVEPSSVDSGQNMSLPKQNNHTFETQALTLWIKCQDLEDQIKELHATASYEDTSVTSTERLTATVSPQQSEDSGAKLIDAERRVDDQYKTIARLTAEASRLKQIMGGSIAEAAVAQQQATMTQSQLDTAAHRESLLLARAKDADDSALEFQRVQQEAKEEKLRSNTRSHCLSGDTAPSVTKTRLDVAELCADSHTDGTNSSEKKNQPEMEIIHEKEQMIHLVLEVGGDSVVSAAAVHKPRAEFANLIKRRASVATESQTLTKSMESLTAQSAATVDPRKSTTEEGQFEERLIELQQENAFLRSHLAGTEEACEKMEKELKRIQHEYNDLAQSFADNLEPAD
mmetsp:Transcript_1644/g.6417  ORF Transcript_1644/g.6417 Transcript_1644/m.6417 type:complete len:936 (-) Transcript_1644:276-3083(-)